LWIYLGTTGIIKGIMMLLFGQVIGLRSNQTLTGNTFC
jgi:hypothetical protein